MEVVTGSPRHYWGVEGPSLLALDEKIVRDSGDVPDRGA